MHTTKPSNASSKATKAQRAQAKALATKGAQQPAAPAVQAQPAVAPQASAAALPVGTPVAPTVAAPKPSRAMPVGGLPTHVVPGPKQGRYNAAGASNANAQLQAAYRAGNGVASVATYTAGCKALLAAGSACNAPGATMAYWLRVGHVAVAPCCAKGPCGK